MTLRSTSTAVDATSALTLIPPLLMSISTWLYGQYVGDKLWNGIQLSQIEGQHGGWICGVLEGLLDWFKSSYLI